MAESEEPREWCREAAQALAAASTASAGLGDLLLAAGDPILIHDAEGIVTDGNPAAAQLLGWPRQALRGRPARRLVWPGAAPRLPDLLARACRGECIREVPAVVLARGGRLLDVHLTLACLQGGASGAGVTVALLRPGAAAPGATEGRQRDDFLAVLGHELRNPLSALDGFAELLERGRAEPRRVAPMMRAQVRQLTALADDLVDVARFMRGKIRLARRSVALDELVEAAAQGTEAAIQARRQRLVIRGPRELRLEADPVRVQQIVANLLSNATRHTPEGGRISVCLRVGAKHAEVRVRDSGAGLDAAMLAHLFEPFVQARPGAGGLGIGLPLSRALAELHGGTLEAASDGPGRGSTFTLRLPRGRAEAQEAPPPGR